MAKIERQKQLDNEELEQYGVWVKVQPEIIDATSPGFESDEDYTLKDIDESDTMSAKESKSIDTNEDNDIININETGNNQNLSLNIPEEDELENNKSIEKGGMDFEEISLDDFIDDSSFSDDNSDGPKPVEPRGKRKSEFDIDELDEPIAETKAAKTPEPKVYDDFDDDLSLDLDLGPEYDEPRNKKSAEPDMPIQTEDKSEEDNMNFEDITIPTAEDEFSEINMNDIQDEDMHEDLQELEIEDDADKKAKSLPKASTPDIDESNLIDDELADLNINTDDDFDAFDQIDFEDDEEDELSDSGKINSKPSIDSVKSKKADSQDIDELILDEELPDIDESILEETSIPSLDEEYPAPGKKLADPDDSDELSIDDMDEMMLDEELPDFEDSFDTDFNQDDEDDLLAGIPEEESMDIDELPELKDDSISEDLDELIIDDEGPKAAKSLSNAFDESDLDSNDIPGIEDEDSPSIKSDLSFDDELPALDDTELSDFSIEEDELNSGDELNTGDELNIDDELNGFDDRVEELKPVEKPVPGKVKAIEEDIDIDIFEDFDIEEDLDITEDDQESSFLESNEPDEIEVALSAVDDIEDKIENEIEEPAAVKGNTAAIPSINRGEELSLLQRIEQELLSIKTELSGLKQELLQLRKGEKTYDQDSKTSEASGYDTGFFDDEEDETIALTGDELNNILNTADITEEVYEESPEAATFDEDVIYDDSKDDIIDESMPAADTQTSDDIFQPGSDESIEGPFLDEEPDMQEILLKEPEPDDEETLLAEANQLAPEENWETSLPGEDLSTQDYSFGEMDTVYDQLDEPIEDMIIEDESDEEEKEETHVPLNKRIDDLLMDESPDDEINEEEILLDIPGSDFEDNIEEENQNEDTEIVFDEDLKQPPDQGDDIGDELEPEEEFMPDELNDLQPDESIEEMEEPEEPIKLKLEKDDNQLELDNNFNQDDFNEESVSQPAKLKTTRDGSLQTMSDGLKNELKSVLSYMDQLLEALPEDKIREFAHSEYFNTYKKLFEELGLN